MKFIAAFALVAAVSGSASVQAAPSAHRPVITSISTSPKVIPASGGRVVVRVAALFGKTCVLSGVSNPVQLSCAHGSASESIVFKANSAATRRVWTIAAISEGVGGASVRKQIALTQAAAAPIAVAPPSAATPLGTTTTGAPVSPTASLSISTTSVPASGGSFTLSYSSSNASSCTLSSTPAFWSGSNPVTVNCSGSYRGSVAAMPTGEQWTFTFTAMTAAGETAVSSQVFSELAPPVSASPNWSGYALPSNSLFTDVGGKWTVPTLNCADTPKAGESTWVGIGGYSWPTGGSSGALLQTGTSERCVNGSQEDQGWFEEYPSTPNAERDFTSFPVSPGDAMSASVFRGSSGAWETKVDDLTTGLSGIMVTGEGWGIASDASSSQAFTQQGSTLGLTYAGGYTAEWIVEDYTDATTGSTVPLANYGTVTFSDLQTSLASWSLTTGEGQAIAQNGVILSTPSAPSMAGFSISYTGP